MVFCQEAECYGMQVAISAEGLFRGNLDAALVC